MMFNKIQPWCLLNYITHCCGWTPRLPCNYIIYSRLDAYGRRVRLKQSKYVDLVAYTPNSPGQKLLRSDRFGHWIDRTPPLLTFSDDLPVGCGCVGNAVHFRYLRSWSSPLFLSANNWALPNHVRDFISLTNTIVLYKHSGNTITGVRAPWK